jgi:hypothetical protein
MLVCLLTHCIHVLIIESASDEFSMYINETSLHLASSLLLYFFPIISPTTTYAWMLSCQQVPYHLPLLPTHCIVLNLPASAISSSTTSVAVDTARNTQSGRFCATRLFISRTHTVSHHLWSSRWLRPCASLTTSYKSSMSKDNPVAMAVEVTNEAPCESLVIKVGREHEYSSFPHAYHSHETISQ